MHTQHVQQRKFWVAVPILVLPFVIAVFWALGGGKQTHQSSTASTNNTAGNLNADLPGAHFRNENNAWDKLSLYQQAQRDSARFREAQRTDPYVSLPALTPDVATVQGAVDPSFGKEEGAMEQTEALVHEKLTILIKV